jgi:putative lipoprotein
VRCLPALFLALLISACAGMGESTDGKAKMEETVITGKVTYRERIMLPPGADVHVVLLDVSKMDVMATTIAETRFAAEQGPPFNFTLPYDASLIQPGMRYSLRATIKRDDKLLFASATALDPFLQPDSDIEIMVQKVGGR